MADASAASWGPERGPWDPGGPSTNAAGSPPALACSETLSLLLPCGLTAEELASITAGPPDMSPTAAPAPQPSVPCSVSAARETRLSFDSINRVAAAVAAEKARLRRLRRQQQGSVSGTPGELALLHSQPPSPTCRGRVGLGDGKQLVERQRSSSEGQVPDMSAAAASRSLLHTSTQAVAPQRSAGIAAHAPCQTTYQPPLPAARTAQSSSHRLSLAASDTPQQAVRSSAPAHSMQHQLQLPPAAASAGSLAPTSQSDQAMQLEQDSADLELQAKQLTLTPAPASSAAVRTPAVQCGAFLEGQDAVDYASLVAAAVTSASQLPAEEAEDKEEELQPLSPCLQEMRSSRKPTRMQPHPHGRHPADAHKPRLKGGLLAAINNLLRH
ncbi:hypothetical protein D9Q98_007359 [Chlorella vulgaris]|uniref:Uncharacterized protein n=1 Tax=Chlorella vulgaris TaxID=3077 RepID=A0A9D4TL37_CHLVU|nr:hypothetical protein D9Q98_007359 [Chlorella vulgaris]